MPHRLRRSGGPPLIIAHRGASERAPENTLAAFALGATLGADGLECDLQRATDGGVVLIHDTTLERTTSGAGPVSAQTAEALRALDAGSWLDPRFAGEGVPGLGELLALPGAGWLLLELKDGGAEGWAALVEATAAALEAAGAASRAVLMSFSEEAVAAAAQRLPEAPALLLLDAEGVAAPEEAWALTRSLGAEAVGVEEAALSPEVIAGAQAAGLAVFAWTVNEVSRARALHDAGVDGLITDAPDRVRAGCRRRPGSGAR